MKKTARDCRAQSATFRASAASASLENVRKVYLEAAASWDMLASRAERSERLSDHSGYLIVNGGAPQAVPSAASPRGRNGHAAKAVPAPAAVQEEADDCADRLPDTAQDALVFPEAAAATPQVAIFEADGNLRPLREIEGDVIRIAICLHKGRLSTVARALGIGRSTLYRKLDQLGIDTGDKPRP